MLKRSMTLAAFTLLGLSGCGGTDHPTITGQWSLTLQPSGQTATQPETLTVEQVYLNEENGMVNGRSDAFTFKGYRSGNLLDLTVFSPDSSGLAVEHSYLKLSLQGDHAVRGSGSTPQPQEPMLGDSAKDDGSDNASSLVYDVSGQLVSAMSSAQAKSAIDQTGVQGAASDIAHTVCSLFSAVESFTMGYLTGNLFRPMGGCIMTKSGGGYYVFGRDAPGSLIPIWTQNVYVPVEWAACTERRYKFKFSYKGPGLLTKGNELIAKSQRNGIDLPGLNLLKVGGKSLADLAVELDNLRAKYGNYALLVATHPRTKFIGLYVIREKGNSDELKNEALIKTVAGNLHASVLVGKDITDTFKLRRGPLPNVCLDQIEFAYLLGSADVTLD